MVPPPFTLPLSGSGIIAVSAGRSGAEMDSVASTALRGKSFTDSGSPTFASSATVFLPAVTFAVCTSAVPSRKVAARSNASTFSAPAPMASTRAAIPPFQVRGFSGSPVKLSARLASRATGGFGALKYAAAASMEMSAASIFSVVS